MIFVVWAFILALALAVIWQATKLVFCGLAGFVRRLRRIAE